MAFVLGRFEAPSQFFSSLLASGLRKIHISGRIADVILPPLNYLEAWLGDSLRGCGMDASAQCFAQAQRTLRLDGGNGPSVT